MVKVCTCFIALNAVVPYQYFYLLFHTDVTLGKAAGGITFTAGSTAADKRGEIHIKEEAIQNLGIKQYTYLVAIKINNTVSTTGIRCNCSADKSIIADGLVL